MPSGIYLYEIDSEFGPKILADYYLTRDKLTPEALKVLSDKHLKELADATYKTEQVRYYSSKVSAEALKIKLYLGFVIKQNEDIMSLKSVFEEIEKNIADNFTKDRRKMQEILKGVLTSILGLMEKLKEPKIIQDKINERTKDLLDEGKVQEAREWIDLGEKIPNLLSSAVKEAEQYYKQKLYKKAKKSYQKAADLASQIQEKEMQAILIRKGDNVGDIPLYEKEREGLNKEIKKILDDMEVRHLNIAYKNAIGIIDKNIKLSNQLEDYIFLDALENLKVNVNKALSTAIELANIDKEIKEILKKL